MPKNDPQFELLISDNASADRTPELCRKLASEDDRIPITRNPRNLGAAGNHNRFFGLSSGEFFRWAIADDISGPELDSLDFREDRTLHSSVAGRMYRQKIQPASKTVKTVKKSFSKVKSWCPEHGLAEERSWVGL